MKIGKMRIRKKWEDVRHIPTECEARDRIFPQLRDILAKVEPSLDSNNLLQDKAVSTLLLICCLTVKNNGK